MGSGSDPWHVRVRVRVQDPDARCASRPRQCTFASLFFLEEAGVQFSLLLLLQSTLCLSHSLTFSLSEAFTHSHKERPPNCTSQKILLSEVTQVASAAVTHGLEWQVAPDLKYTYIISMFPNSCLSLSHSLLSSSSRASRSTKRT